MPSTGSTGGHGGRSRLRIHSELIRHIWRYGRVWRRGLVTSVMWVLYLASPAVDYYGSERVIRSWAWYCTLSGKRGGNVRKASTALAVVGLLLLAGPVLAQSSTIVIEVTKIHLGDEGEIIRVASVDVDPGMVGWLCTGTAQTENNASEHPDNDFILTSGSSSAEILDWEAVAAEITHMSGTLVLGESITVDLRLGPNGVSSGEVRIVLTCSPPPPPETTTTTVAETTTTTAPETTTTTTSPTTTTTHVDPPPTTVSIPPDDTTTTEHPPVGGVSAGGGATAAGGWEAAVLWLAGGALGLLSGAALFAQRRLSGRE